MMISIKLLSGRRVRVEAAAVRLDGFGDRVFCAHNAIDELGRLIDGAFTVTDYKTGVGIADRVYGTVEDAITTARSKVAQRGAVDVGRILANFDVINHEEVDEWVK